MVRLCILKIHSDLIGVQQLNVDLTLYFNRTICHEANLTTLNGHIVLIFLIEPPLLKLIKVKLRQVQCYHFEKKHLKHMSTLNFCAIPQLRKHIVSYTKFIVNTFTHTLIMLLKGYSLQYIHLHIHYAKETPYYTIIHSHIHYSKNTPNYTKHTVQII